MKKVLTGITLAVCFLSACSSKQGSTSNVADSTTIKAERNKQTALSAMAAVQKGDIDGIVKYCAPKFTDYQESGPVTNMDSVKAGLKNYLTAFPIKADNLKAVASGDTVILLGDWSGTFKGDFMGIKANGKSFKYPDADVFVFDKDGKMVSHRAIQSMMTIFAQLGVTPPTLK